jgi:hypothetical protein
MSRNVPDVTATSGRVLSVRTVRLAKVMGAGLLLLCLGSGAALAGAIIFFHIHLELTDSLINVLLIGTLGLGLCVAIGVGLLMLSFVQDVRANAAARRRWSMRLRLSGVVCLYIGYVLGLAASALAHGPLPLLGPLPPLSVAMGIGIFVLWGIGFMLILAAMIARMIEASRTAVVRYWEMDGDGRNPAR